MHIIKIPNLGVMVENVRIVEWCKKEGEHVNNQDILVRVETEKALFEIEAETSGILYYILAKEGEVIPVQSVIGVISSQDERLPARSEITKKIGSLKSGVLSEMPKKQSLFSKKKYASTVEGKSTPRARVLAKEKGVSLPLLRGSGPGGIVTESDVEKHYQKTRMRIAIINAAKGGRMVYETILKDSFFEVVGFIDDNPGLKGKTVAGLPVLGTTSEFKRLKEKKIISGVYVAIGNSIDARVRVALKAKKSGLELISIVDKSSIISQNVKIGRNVWIKEAAIIGMNSEIGDNVIVDSGCILSHDVNVSYNCHLSPGCVFGGTVSVGENTIIGVGASIGPYVKIGKYVIVSPGSSVVHDIPDHSIIDGVPGKVIGYTHKKKRI